MGYEIAHTTIAQIRAGTYPSRPSRKTLEAVAYLAGVPYAAVHKAAGLGTPGRPFADQLPQDVDDLDARQREVVIIVIRALLDGRGQQSVGLDHPDGPTGPDHRGSSVAYVTDEEFDNPPGGSSVSDVPASE